MDFWPTAFWTVAALMTAAVTALVMAPLMRSKDRRQAPAAERASYDLEVYRDQLAELDRDFARGVIERRQADAARAEIGRRMLTLADAPKAAPVAAGTGRGSRWVALALCVLIPLGTLAVYLRIGQPNLPAQPFASRQTNPGNSQVASSPQVPPEVMQAIAKLQQHLKDEPGDLQGWLLMGQTYTRMARFDDAVEAYAQAVGISQGTNPVILSSFAEAQIAAAQGMVGEEAQRIFEGVLQKDPQDARARYYLALARAQSGDFRGALDRWVELAAQSPADAPWMPTVQQRIADMAGRLGVEVSSVMPQPQAPSQPQAPGPSREQMADAANMAPEQRNQMIRGMVDNLAVKLRDNPGDADGWMRLG